MGTRSELATKRGLWRPRPGQTRQDPSRSDWREDALFLLPPSSKQHWDNITHRCGGKRGPGQDERSTCR